METRLSRQTYIITHTRKSELKKLQHWLKECVPLEIATGPDSSVYLFNKAKLGGR